MSKHPEIFSYQRPNLQILNYAAGRMDIIKKEIEQLNLEYAMLERIIAVVEPLVCATCFDAGHVMRLIAGNECDGPRMHECPECKRKGKQPADAADRREG